MESLKEFRNSMSASESFQARVDNCTILLEEIKREITRVQDKQEEKPLDWGFSGSMSHTQELLELTLESLKGVS